MTLVTWVVQVVEVVDAHLKSLKVDLEIEDGAILSEKVALALVARPTPVPVGVAPVTLGAVFSGGGAVVKVQLWSCPSALPARFLTSPDSPSTVAV